MDDDLKELSMILARNSTPSESSLTVRWAAVIGVISVICGFLFVGYGTNSRRQMVTNERVVMPHPDNWKIEVLEYFNGKYETII